MTDEETVADLLAERAIRRVLLRYCRGIDRMDRALVRACYHDDAVDDHGTFRGGPDELVEWVWRLLSRYQMTFHFVGNMLIELDGADTARAETYGIAFHRSAGDLPQGNLVTGFRYIDRFERRPLAAGPAEWRIARRVCTTEWVRVDTPEGRWPIPEGMLQGSRDPTDPVYSRNLKP